MYKYPAFIFTVSAIISLNACQVAPEATIATAITKTPQPTPATDSTFVEQPVVVSPQPVTKPPATEVADHNPTRLLQNLQPSAQRFEINQSEGAEIVGKHGTRLAFPAHSFVDDAGNEPEGPVTVQMTEYNDLVEILSAQLDTRSGNKLLETGGMLYVEATAGSKSLKLRSGSSAMIAFRAEATQRDMQLFRGVRTAGRVDWIPLNDSRPAVTPAMYKPCSFPGGEDALTVFFSRYVTADDAATMSGKAMYAIHMNVGSDGKASLRQITPEAPTALVNSVRKVIRNMPAWQSAKRLGVPVSDTALQYLTFEYRMSFGGDVDTIDGQPGQTITTIDKGAMYNAQRYSVLNSNTLGWINCDRFLNDTRERVDYFVKTDDPGERVTLVFHTMRSCMNGRPVAGGVFFDNIPMNESITIVGFKGAADGLYAALATTDTRTRRTAPLVYSLANMSDLKSKLAQLLPNSVAGR
jgi:hypothetical protein